MSAPDLDPLIQTAISDEPFGFECYSSDPITFQDQASQTARIYAIWVALDIWTLDEAYTAARSIATLNAGPINLDWRPIFGRLTALIDQAPAHRAAFEETWQQASYAMRRQAAANIVAGLPDHEVRQALLAHAMTVLPPIPPNILAAAYHDAASDVRRNERWMTTRTASQP